MKKAFFVWIFAFLCVGPVLAESETSAAKKLAVERLMEVSNTSHKMRQFIPVMFHRLMNQSTMSSFSKGGISKDEFADLLSQLLLARLEGPNGLIAQTCMLYEKYYSLEEIEELTKFYGSPVGKKVLAVAETMLVDPARLPELLASGFAPDEVQAFAQFLGSPLGTKTLSVAGKMSVEQAELGKQIALELMPELLIRMLAMMKEKGVSPPDSGVVLIDNPPKKYPLMSLRLGEEGAVVLRLVVTAKGTVGFAAVKTSSGFSRLDQAAKSAAENLRFLPAIEKGKPIEKSVEMKFIFKREEIQDKPTGQNPKS